MQYKLKANDGRVNYVIKTGSGAFFRNTRQDSAEWMLREYKPRESTEFDGYPICVKVECGTEYFFQGEVLESREKKRRFA